MGKKHGEKSHQEKKASRRNAAGIPDLKTFFTQNNHKGQSQKQEEEVIEVSSDSAHIDRGQLIKQRTESNADWTPPQGVWEGVEEEERHKLPPAGAREGSKPRKRRNRKGRKQSRPPFKSQRWQEECLPETIHRQSRETSPSYSGLVVDVDDDDSPRAVEAEALRRDSAGNDSSDSKDDPAAEKPIGRESKYFQAADAAEPKADSIKQNNPRRKMERPKRVTLPERAVSPDLGAKRREKKAARAGVAPPDEPAAEGDVELAAEDVTTEIELTDWMRQAPIPGSHGLGIDTSASEQPLGPAASSGVPSGDELLALCCLRDDELRERLPEIGESEESLALLSQEGRRARIRAAMAARDAQRTLDFRQSLEARQQEIREDKKRAAAEGIDLSTPVKKQRETPRKRNSPIQLSPVAPTAAAALPGTDSPHNTNMRIALWEPPVSPYSLLEEALYNDPWRVLVACMLLNKTTGKAVRRVLWRLFELAPTPEAAAVVDTTAVEAIIQPLGLHRKRALMFKRFSKEYLADDVSALQWSDPQQLHGIGRYAADAYFIFCRNQWRERSPPLDKDLLRYYEWLKSTGGQGEGYEREVFAMPSSSASGESGAIAGRSKRQQASQSAGGEA